MDRRLLSATSGGSLAEKTTNQIWEIVKTELKIQSTRLWMKTSMMTCQGILRQQIQTLNLVLLS